MRLKRKSRRRRWMWKWAAWPVLFLLACGAGVLLSNAWQADAVGQTKVMAVAGTEISQAVKIAAAGSEDLPVSSAKQSNEPTEQVLTSHVQLSTAPPTISTPATVPEERRWIALTFDDGPDGKYTPQVLDILKDKEVKATFFLVGTQVEKYPEVVKRIADEGHTIGNHSWSHKDLSRMKPEALDSQVKRTQEAISDAAGAAPVLVRAPYGALSDDFLDYLHEQNLQHVYWTIDPRDWDGTSVTDMRKNILKHAKPGGIILLHSFGGRKHALDHTLKLLPLIIDDLRKEGYELTTVDAMIDTEAVVASAIK